MDTSKLLISGLIGGAVAFLLGFLVYGMLMADFFAANAGSATGIARGDEEMLWIPMVLGHLSWGLLLALVIGYWGSISTFVTGAKAGAMVGFLSAATFDLIGLGSTHIMNPTAVVTDILLVTIIAAITGGVIGWYLGRGK